MGKAASHILGESEYLHHQFGAGLTHKTRQRPTLQQRRQRNSGLSRTNEPAVLEAVERDGHDSRTSMPPLVALMVQGVLADGCLTHAEHNWTVAIASLRGAEPNSKSCKRLTAQAEQRPQEERFRGTLNAVDAVIQTLSPIELQTRRETFLFCFQGIEVVSSRHPWWLRRKCSAKRGAAKKIGMLFLAEAVRNRLRARTRRDVWRLLSMKAN